ncbi:hypothetical protein QQ045_022091 [Rhodiola kirilowii]
MISTASSSPTTTTSSQRSTHYSDDLQQSPIIPIIDLSSSPNNPLHLDLIRNACEKWGAFQITGHGISLSVLNEVEAETRRLFDLPIHRKKRALRSPGSVSGYGQPPVSLRCPKRLWSEGFTIMGSSVAEHAAKLWPVRRECNKFCSVFEDYEKKVVLVAKKTIALILSSLGLINDDVSWMRDEKDVPAATVIQLNSYPVCLEPAQAMGMPPHTDSSMVTILYQGNVAGLQLQNESRGWVPVPPVEGALVVNLGDLMHIVSNGRYRSVMHRAVVDGTEHRISVAYFYGSPPGVEVGPAGTILGEGESPVYGSVTWKVYLGLKGRHGQKALEMIKMNYSMK